jgi:hypothetical protein
MKIKILFNNIDFPVTTKEDLSFGKSYKSVLVNLENYYYEVTFYHIARLIQDLESQSYFANPGLIIVNELTYMSISETIVELVNLHYFSSRMLPIEKNKIAQFQNYRELKFLSP